MLSPKQTAFYWNTWNQVCALHAWRNNDATRRHALHSEARCPASMRDFGNADFDRFLSYCRRLLGSKECTESRAKDGARKRLIWRIAQDAKTAMLDEAYLTALCTDLYGIGCWQELSLADLTKFRNTIHDRAGRHVGADTRSLQRDLPRRRYVLRKREPVVAKDLQPF